MGARLVPGVVIFGVPKATARAYSKGVRAHDVSFRRRARRVYERARLVRALAAAWPAGIMLALGCILHGRGGPHLVLPALVLSLAITFLSWRGSAWVRGIKPGLIVGGLTLLVATSLRLPCLVACVAIGLTGGVGVAVLSRGRSLAALVVVAPIGAIACGSIAPAGGLAIVAGLAVGRLVSSCVEALDRI